MVRLAFYVKLHFSVNDSLNLCCLSCFICDPFFPVPRLADLSSLYWCNVYLTITVCVGYSLHIVSRNDKPAEVIQKIEWIIHLERWGRKPMYMSEFVPAILLSAAIFLLTTGNSHWNLMMFRNCIWALICLRLKSCCSTITLQCRKPALPLCLYQDGIDFSSGCPCL